MHGDDLEPGRAPRGEEITPVRFRPLDAEAPAARPRRVRDRIRLRHVALPILAVALAAVAWFGTTAVSVTLEFEPPPDHVAFPDTRLSLAVGKSVLLRPGSHRVRATKRGYRPLETTIEVAPEAESRFAFTLVETPGSVTVRTEPPAALPVRVAGREFGSTPLVLELPRGAHRITVRGAPDFTDQSVEVEVEGLGASQELLLALVEARAPVTIASIPPGAALRIDGEERGVTPTTLSVAAGTRSVELRLSGYANTVAEVEVEAGVPQELPPFRLAPAAGTLEVSSVPAGAEVRLEPSADRKAAQPEAPPSRRGPELRLIQGGRFELGSSRQDRGRRANENRVLVEITRPYYLGVREVTNREFRGFRPDHRSGRAAGESLDGDDQPVTGVSWDDAARYCNWLSGATGLAPAYEERAGQIFLAQPRTNGYRLPSEAEWVWAARYAGGKRDQALRFPWGDAMPPPAGAGNYADASAATVLPNVLARYQDGHAVTAPVAQSDADALGMRDLGGNVAEWVQDFYQIYPRGLEHRLRDPVGPNRGRYRVIRGASWRDSSLTELRLSYRDYSDRARDDVGFRVARDAN